MLNFISYLNTFQDLGMHILRYLPQLMELDLSGNAMRKIVVQFNYYYFIYKFKLKTSDFSSSATLRMINLSRNAIESIECDTSLQMLSVNNNFNQCKSSFQIYSSKPWI